MSLVKYEILNKVAEAKSFTKAGVDLGLTQSAVSHAVSSLEKEFGFALVHRSKHGVTLTIEGQLILQPIRQILAAQELVKQEAANILGVTKGTIRIGTFSSISSKWLPAIIQLMDHFYPGVKIELREGDYFEIEQWLLEGEVDCGFLNRTQSTELRFQPLILDQLLCIVSAASSLFTRGEIEITDVELEPFIMTSYNGTNDVLSIFERYGVKPDIRYELYDEKGIVSMVSHGLGISILPQLVLDELPSNVRAIPIKQESYRTIGLATKYRASPATEKFIEILTDWLNSNEHVIKVE